MFGRRRSAADDLMDSIRRFQAQNPPDRRPTLGELTEASRAMTGRNRPQRPPIAPPTNFANAPVRGNRAQATTYRPGYGERIADGVGSLARLLGHPDPNRLRSEAEYLPFVGDGITLGQGVSDLRNGNIVSGIGNTLLGAIGAVPGVGDAAAGLGKNALAMFLGVNARTANRNALQQAQDMVARGADRGEIWNQTGWFRGPDQQWRFEIDDSGMAMRDNAVERVASGERTATYAGLPAVVRHPELYAAAPGTQAIQVRSGDLQSLSGAGSLGSYAPTNNYNGMPTITVDDAMLNDPAQARSVLAHEIQHDIQGTEGFARGGSPDEFFQQDDARIASDAIMIRNDVASRMRDGMDRAAAEAATIRDLQELGWTLNPEAVQVAKDLTGNPDNQLAELITLYGLDRRTTPLSPREGYRRLGGEVEARNVQTRLDFTPEQRRARPPWETQDVPDDEQIIRFR